MPEFELTASPSPEELAAITDALSAFNNSDVGPSDRRPLAVLIRDTDGKVTGGLSGFTAWGWLFTQMLYIPDTLRGTGISGTILTKAEEEARARGCRGAWIDTFSPQALRVYLRQGYEVFGELEDFPEGRTRSFLRKSL
ncbi:GNAT family N-acetyltransferase [Rhizobium ruizarguesonis]|jgi:GNAT superfamily N-acetyltransferase|uniref:GNAT family N-acetyltransferase n=1 Tax=Rhizobium ruizarguesonis TaxID=2081791 RepID=A0AAE4YSL2_9HYPH|nr:GNAT family N-acetyltransferase [Rhizobium ruizarguesonis]MBY5802096.1 GNAT family N-acetyltransferase [Rhizobium leguminosarum]NKL14429.1 GNAT family N-acetyltransferase [Rhizobium leguminosarum bv. viciae]QIO46912.1 GNAT family N-acetyltransferase [Rhizobium leguminosarum bv. trifolii]QJS28760.1 GNAT family N-acetyltransferase [Rhizobium leguminosarum bv. trifolii TA1]MBC2804997.1 GNAT family N-acetyltransferase [Rhizobium ruizarguesonis]